MKKNTKATCRKSVNFLAAAAMTAALLGSQAYPAMVLGQTQTVEKASLIPDNVTIDEPTSLSNIDLPKSDYGTLYWTDSSYVPDSRVQSCKVEFKPNSSVDLSGYSGWDAEKGVLTGYVTVVVSSIGSSDDYYEEDDYDNGESWEETQSSSETPSSDDTGESADTQAAEGNQNPAGDGQAENRAETAPGDMTSEPGEESTAPGAEGTPGNGAAASEPGEAAATAPGSITATPGAEGTPGNGAAATAPGAEGTSESGAAASTPGATDPAAPGAITATPGAEGTPENGAAATTPGAEGTPENGAAASTPGATDPEASGAITTAPGAEGTPGNEAAATTPGAEGTSESGAPGSVPTAPEAVTSTPGAEAQTPAETGAPGEENQDAAAPEAGDTQEKPENSGNIFDNPMDFTSQDDRPSTAEENLSPEEQQERARQNHSCDGIFVSGIELPWYVQFRVSSGESYEFKNEAGAMIFQSYEFELWDLRNNTEYQIPDGEYISVTVPVKEGYSYTIEHILDNGATETIVPSVNGGTMVFSTHSFSPFGIAGSKPLVGGDIAQDGYSGGTTATPTPAAQATVTAAPAQTSSGNSGTVAKPTNIAGNAGTSSSSGSTASSGSSQTKEGTVRNIYGEQSGQTGTSSTGTNTSTSTNANTGTNGSSAVNTVRTGDDTVILPFVILVAAAIVIIAAVAVVKKKRNH